MKTKTIISTFILLLIMIGIGFAQAPKKFNYQAILRDNNGAAISNQAVTLRISIKESSETGTVLYSETHSAITASTGLVSLQIGGGTPEAGFDFSAIDWSYKTKYIQLEIDAEAGTNFVNMGSAELLSVPYALYAEESGSNSSKGLTWDITGNAGTNPALNFIGTTDDKDLIFKRKNLRAGRIGLTNTSFGLNALNPLVTGTYNTAFGLNALSSITTGATNTATGSYALNSCTTGESNTANGLSALYFNISGRDNTAIGSFALYRNVSGRTNTAVGLSALSENTFGNFNTASGNGALFSNKTGNDNTAFGNIALYSNVSGCNNTAIGDSSLKLVTTGSNNIGLGNNAQVPLAAGNNQVRIGNTSITYAGVQVGWSITSDKRLKSDIKNTDLGLDFVMKLNPVSYSRISDETKKIEYGFIAQELEETLNLFDAKNNGIISKDDDGMYSVRYNDLIAPMVKAIQEQQQIISDQQLAIKALEQSLKTLEAKISK